MDKTPVAGLLKEHVFHFNYTSNMGQSYTGFFKAKRPTLIMQSKIAAKKAELLGGFYYNADQPGTGVPEEQDALAEMLAFLEVVLVEAPDWWQQREIYDIDVLYELYREAVKVDPFRPQQLPELSEQLRVGGAESAAESDKSGSERVLEALVDEEVSDAAESSVIPGVTSRRSSS